MSDVKKDIKLSGQQKAFFLICLKLATDQAENLFNLVEGAEVHDYHSLYEDLKKWDSSTIQSVAHQELKKIKPSLTPNYLNDVHSDWLADLLAKESPEMWAVILQYLPKEKSEQILSGLPISTRETIRVAKAALQPSASIALLLQSYFENKFLIPKIKMPRDQIEFQHIPWLRSFQIERLFKTLGYYELAMGLLTLPDTAQNMVLDRLNPLDQKYVQESMTQVQAASKNRLDLAKQHLAALDLNNQSSASFI